MKAMVLGASSGLGAFLAKRLVEDGWEVVGTGTRKSGPERSGFRYIRADLSDAATLEVLLAELQSLQPDLIVHSAVTYGPRDQCLDLSALETMFRVNGLLPYLLVYRYLVAEPAARCCCIMVNSDSIFHATALTGAYAASKAALRVLTASLALRCKSGAASVATLLLGPLLDEKKRTELGPIARRRGLTEEAITRHYLERSNPFLAIDSLIDPEHCYRSVAYLHSLGKAANGMLCKLDGGSSGSLI